MNIRYQDEIVDQFPTPASKFHNISINRLLQSNLRFYPGRWIRFLTPFTFELNYQLTLRGYLRNFSEAMNLADKFLNASDCDELTFCNEGKTYQIRGEWRPSASLLFYSDFSVLNLINQNLGSQLQTHIQRMNQKMEYRPTIHSLITIQYFRDHEQKLAYSTTIRDNPMIWFENRWSERLYTRLNFTYRHEERKIGRLSENMSNFSPLLGITYRFRDPASGKTRTEIRNDASFSFYRSLKIYQDDNYNSLSNAFAIDYYPTSVFILRFRLVTSYKDLLDSNQDVLSNTLEFRLTAQF